MARINQKGREFAQRQAEADLSGKIALQFSRGKAKSFGQTLGAN
jgi:hypothetical protein